MSKLNPVEAALEIIYGKNARPEKLAALCDVSRTAAENWLKDGKVIKASHAIVIAEALAGAQGHPVSLEMVKQLSGYGEGVTSSPSPESARKSTKGRRGPKDGLFA